MARSLDQIIAELDPAYAGSRNTIQTQVNALPGETEQQLSGLQAQAQQSHADILDSARRRGLGFSGIPVGEQVRYDATTFKPAVANMYAAQNQRKMSLDEALNSLYRDQRTQATGLQQSELDREEQRRQFEANLAWQREQMDRQERMAREQAAASRAAGSYLGGGGGAMSGGSGGSAAMTQGPNGFQFVDGAGRPISAAAYANQKGVGFRELLTQMANAGDKNAQLALHLVGNDYMADPGKLANGFDTKTVSYGGNNSDVRSALKALGVLNV